MKPKRVLIPGNCTSALSRSLWAITNTHQATRVEKRCWAWGWRKYRRCRTCVRAYGWKSCANGCERICEITKVCKNGCSGNRRGLCLQSRRGTTHRLFLPRSCKGERESVHTRKIAPRSSKRLCNILTSIRLG